MATVEDTASGARGAARRAVLVRRGGRVRVFPTVRTRWAGTINASAYGVRFGVRLHSTDLVAPAAARFPPGWRRSATAEAEEIFSLKDGGERAGYQLYAGATLIAGSDHLAVVLDRLESDIQLIVAERAPRRIFVHAGAVGWRGRAVLLPGRSLAGKTTLVAELVRRGADYYSDEYAVLDSRGRLHPYARPLAVRREGSLRQTKVPIEVFGGRAGEGSLPVGLVVSCDYRKGAEWAPEAVTPGAALLELLSNTVPARRSPKRALAALSAVVTGAALVKTARGEASAAAEAILRLSEAIPAGGLIFNLK